MKGVADLLYLERRRACPRQILPTEIWLAICQVQEYAVALSQNPKCANVGEPGYDQMLKRAKEMVMAETENLVHLSCAVVYDLLRRVLREDE